MVRCERILAESKIAQILSLGHPGMTVIHIGAPEVLGRGVDDEYHFGRDGICALAGLSGRLFDRQWEIVN